MGGTLKLPETEKRIRLFGAGFFKAGRKGYVTANMEGQDIKASFSIPSILALVAAIGSFATGAFWGLLLAIAAIILGIIGIVLAASPRTRGGVISMFAMAAGVIGIIAAVVKAILWLA